MICPKGFIFRIYGGTRHICKADADWDYFEMSLCGVPMPFITGDHPPRYRLETDGRLVCRECREKVKNGTHQQVQDALKRNGHTWFVFGSHEVAGGIRVDHPTPEEFK